MMPLTVTMYGLLLHCGQAVQESIQQSIHVPVGSEHCIYGLIETVWTGAESGERQEDCSVKEQQLICLSRALIVLRGTTKT